MKYLLIYPPIGKQKVGNFEVLKLYGLNKFPESLAKQIRNREVKVIGLSPDCEFEELVPTTGEIGEPRDTVNRKHFRWESIKTVRETDQKEVIV